MPHSSPKPPRAESTPAYSDLGLDIGFVPAIWHISRVSHLLEKELERVCGAYGLSSADINLLGAIWNTEAGKLRATDLADMLRVSNAVMSPRVARLVREGLLQKTPSTTDRRAVELSLTPASIATMKSVFRAIGTDTEFVRHFSELPEQDQKHLVRILETLHHQMFRNFISRSR